MKPDLKSTPLPVACFAPPLTDEKLARYRELAVAEPNLEVRDVMLDLLTCVEKWWNLPESKERGKRWGIRHRGKDVEFTETPLSKALIDELDSVTPWPRELTTLSNSHGTGLFDGLPAGELRDAAFHLLWHVTEIAKDREPLTMDKLPG